MRRFGENTTFLDLFIYSFIYLSSHLFICCFSEPRHPGLCSQNARAKRANLCGELFASIILLSLLYSRGARGPDGVAKHCGSVCFVLDILFYSGACQSFEANDNLFVTHEILGSYSGVGHFFYLFARFVEERDNGRGIFRLTFVIALNCHSQRCIFYEIDKNKNHFIAIYS